MTSPDVTLEHSVRTDLAAESLRLSGTLRIRVTGWSMLPTIWPGDTIVVSTADHSQIAAGDIALFRREDDFFVHRVLGKSSAPEEILSRGDCMPEPDQPFTSSELLGKVQFIVRGEKRIEPSRNVSASRRAVAGLLRFESAARIAVKARELYHNLPVSRET
jgi:signal peptidase I